AMLPHEALLFFLPAGFVRGVEGRDYVRVWVSNKTVVRGTPFIYRPAVVGKGESGVEFIANDGVTSLSQRVSRADLDRDGWEAFKDTRASMVDDDVVALESLIKIIFGTLALINAAPGTLERRPVPAALRKRRGPPESTTWLVGRTVKIDQRLVAA